MEPVTVRTVHLRRLGYCAGGVRAFFARYGLDYSAFLRDGIGSDKLEQVGDAMGLAAVEEARKDGRRE